jgi:hypothetical protein
LGTPTDLSHTGAPDSTYDTIYSFDDQPSVADSAPGDPAVRFPQPPRKAGVMESVARDAKTRHCQRDTLTGR